MRKLLNQIMYYSIENMILGLTVPYTFYSNSTFLIYEAVIRNQIQGYGGCSNFSTHMW